MLLHYLGKLESKSDENHCGLNTCFILLALTRWNLNRFSQFFHCCEKKKIINKTTTNWKNFFTPSLERFMRAVQFALVSSCARTSPFSCRCLFYPLHRMQGGLVRRKVSVCLSVRQTRALWHNGRKICPNFYTIRKIIQLSFLRRRMVGGGGDNFYLNFRSTGPRWSKIADFEPIFENSTNNEP